MFFFQSCNRPIPSSITSHLVCVVMALDGNERRFIVDETLRLRSPPDVPASSNVVLRPQRLYCPRGLLFKLSILEKKFVTVLMSIYIFFWFQGIRQFPGFDR
ncbi:unnamed protein product [Haemonchus placei]|uniref:Secreted protein n=1 Tax=Haemonchus placei TaxID=6290 RepID=A0A0N4WVM5_HAEPC|nr:unnamed protein product [Haemonchus placei]